jgi:hypothetical protein
MTSLLSGFLRAIGVAIVMISFVAACSTQPQGQTARDLFYHDLNANHAQGESSNLASAAANAAYRLELTRGEDPPVMVNNGFTFKTGDKVRIYIKVSSPVYAYVMATGSSGKKSLLYPPPGSSEDNHLEAGKEYPVPSKGVLEFDNNPGTEHLLVALSKEPLDESKALELNGAALSPDLLTGKPLKFGDYSVMSSGSDALVYVSNPHADKPTTIELALNHNQTGDNITAASGGRKVLYHVSSLTGEHEDEYGLQEALVAMVPENINVGDRDQYVVGLNHLYANYLLQAFQPPKFYTQENGRELNTSDNGETVRRDNFSGAPVHRGNPAECASPDGIAYIEECFSKGKPNLVMGEFYQRQGWFSNKKIYAIKTGHDLDQAWEANGQSPVIIGVCCKAKMFGFPDGYHVIVLSDRREAPAGKEGKTSKFQYMVNNSWGKHCNGWASADGLACAIDYDGDPEHDQSAPPERSVDSDMLQPPTREDKYARGDDGLIMGDDERKTGWNQVRSTVYGESRDAGEPQDPDPADDATYTKSADDEAAELKQHLSDQSNGVSAKDRDVAEKGIASILSGKKDDGAPRRFPLSAKQQAAILHEANRLFNEEQKVLGQGFDQGARNRALVAMIHDIANPDHINQGAQCTCNVTTIAKIECMKRPATQAKHFVDMYTNFNGDQSVNMPP